MTSPDRWSCARSIEQGNKIARALPFLQDDLKNAGMPAGLENGDQSMLLKNRKAASDSSWMGSWEGTHEAR